MPVFGSYAQFYDALYQDKDYEAECDFLEAIFKQHAKGSINNILDLGCGTGSHIIPLAQQGYLVTGVDQSENMLSAAQIKANARCSTINKPAFHQADIWDFNLHQSFDAVISMFAVISYSI